MDKPDKINKLHGNIRSVILEAKSLVRKTVNYVIVIQNWEIGRMIVEEEQDGKVKAEYGKYIIKELSEKLTKEFGSSYDERNLRYYRKFYLIFPIWNALRSELNIIETETNKKRNALRSELKLHENKHSIIHHALRDKSHYIYKIINTELSWTHYRSLLKVENPKAREFYIKEVAENGWGTRALDRQINSFYYERLLSSQEKQPVIDEMKKKTGTLKPEDVLKDPLVLEFLELKENKRYLESELEQALIDKMNEFLLELGKGFAFVARQKRISTESKHFYIDLVFYNYLLKCFVLIDLKTGELTHQDVGQMDMYVRLYEDKYKASDDNPTIGLILCSKKDETIVKYSVMNENKNMFASKYMLYLPSEDELRKELELQKANFEKQL